MDDRWANIDLAFRNGLKDYEVLPPPEVWNNIHPVIKRRPSQFILLRAAAFIALILSISFIAYRLSRETLTEPNSNVVALNAESVSPLISPSTSKPLTVEAKEKISYKDLSETSNKYVPEITLEPVEENTISPEVTYLQQTNSLSMYKTKPLPPLTLSALNSQQKNIFKINEPDLLYISGNSKMSGTDRWSVGAIASPTFYSSFNSGSSEISKQVAASEKPLVSYTGGVAFSYKINKRFSIQSGLYYSSLGQEVDGINSFSGFQNYNYTKGGHNFEVLTTNGTIYTDNSDVFLMADGEGDRIMTAYTKDVFDPKKASLQYVNNSLHQNFSYLELPVILRYKVVDKIIGINLLGGVSYNLLVNNSVYTLINGTKYPIGKTEGLNQISLSSTLGMGMEYNFSGNFSLSLEPTFRYYLNPFNEVSGSKFHPYSFGIFSGISYKF
jgi:hypothetical protein